MKHTDYVILGLLSEAPMTGYQIKRLINIRFRFFWSESYGQLYPSLKTLSAKGYIEEEKTAQATTRRAQKTYRLTSHGLEAIRSWLAQPVEKESVRLEILLKMYFSHLVDAEVMLEHVLRFKQAHEKDLHLLNLFDQELKAIVDEDPAHPTILRVIDFGKKANLAYLDWCQETISFLEGRMGK